jgi:hypothetical protein
MEETSTRIRIVQGWSALHNRDELHRDFSRHIGPDATMSEMVKSGGAAQEGRRPQDLGKPTLALRRGDGRNGPQPASRAAKKTGLRLPSQVKTGVPMQSRPR